MIDSSTNLKGRKTLLLAPAQINRVWFDDVAIGETYIGPIPVTSGVEMK